MEYYIAVIARRTCWANTKYVILMQNNLQMYFILTSISKIIKFTLRIEYNKKL